MKIRITWKAFGDKPDIGRFIRSVEFELPEGWAIGDERVCEQIYKQTNLYKGPLWDIIQPMLSEYRTHTALSIGDEVAINNKAYTVADFGFIPTEKAEMHYLSDDYGIGVVWKVTERVGEDATK